MSFLNNDSHLRVTELRETDLNTNAESPDSKDENGSTVSRAVVFESDDMIRLEVPERTNSGGHNYSSSAEDGSRINGRRKSSKWPFKGRRESNAESIARSQTGTGSMLSVGSNDMEGRISRRKSVMHGLMKRGRTIRKTMRAMQINQPDSHDHERDSRRAGVELTTEQRLRMYVLREIVETEEDYTRLLQFIVDTMIPSLNKCAQDGEIASVSHNTVSNMLSNIKDIHKLHVKFSSALKEATQPFPYYTNRIGNIFLRFRDEFRLYAKYCTNFKNAQKICYELEKDERVLKLIKEWMESVASKTRKFLHLEGFVISPVQRLCKYPLLLRELKKFTNESSPDSEAVSEAMTMMEEITASVNESERRAIAMQAIKDLEDACDSWEKNGCMTKQGFMTKRGGSVKTWNIRWFTLCGYKMSYFHEPTDIKPLGVLDLTSYKSIEMDASHVGRPFSFGIKMPERSFYMYCVNENEKQEWMSILKWKISCIDRSRRQAHKPLETVIFASLSSFLNPKDQKTDFKEDNPVGDKSESVPLSEPGINKHRSKSFFSLSFRSRKGRKEISIASKPTSKEV